MGWGRWLFVLLAMLVIAGLSRAWLTAWLFYSLGAILLLAIAVAARPSRLREARRRLNTTHAEVGQEVVVDLALTWDRPVGPAWVLAKDAVADGLQILTPTGRLFVGNASPQTNYAYRVAATRRGYFPLGPLTLSRGDLFGIFRSDMSDPDIAYLTAYPKVVPVPALRLPSNRPLGDVRTQRRIQEDPTRMVGVRDYQPGDNLTRIHWKATARSGALTTKVFEPSSDIDVAVVLNLAKDDYPAEGDTVELACTTAASLTAALLLARDSVSLSSNGVDAAVRLGVVKPAPPEVRAERNAALLPTLLARLARLEPAADQPLERYLTEVHSRLPWTSTLLLITHRLTEAAGEALNNLERSGFALALIIVGDSEEANAAAARAASLNLLAAWVKTEDQLGVLEFWRPGRH